MPKPVALILLNWNTFQHSLDCISSLQQHGDSQFFDIILADNGSTDQSFSKLKAAFPDLIFIDNERNLGFAEGNNRALQYSLDQGYSYSFLLNTDTKITQDCIAPLLAYMESNPQVGAAQPAIYWMHKPDQLWNGPSYFNRYTGRIFSNNKETGPGDTGVKKVDWVTGCAVIIRNQALKKAGLFTEAFFLYYEDVDLSFRIHQAGYDLRYFPTCNVYHEAGASGKQQTKNKEGTLSPIIHYYLVRNKFWMIRKYGHSFFIPAVILLNSFYYVALLGYFCLRRRWKKAGFLIKGMKDGLFQSKKSIWHEQSLA